MTAWWQRIVLNVVKASVVVDDDKAKNKYREWGMGSLFHMRCLSSARAPRFPSCPALHSTAVASSFQPFGLVDGLRPLRLGQRFARLSLPTAG